MKLSPGNILFLLIVSLRQIPGLAGVGVGVSVGVLVGGAGVFVGGTGVLVGDGPGVFGGPSGPHLTHSILLSQDPH